MRNIFVAFIALSAFVLGIVLMYQNTNCDRYIHKLLEYYFNNNQVRTTIKKLSTDKNNVIIHKITTEVSNTFKMTLDNIKTSIYFDLADINNLNLKVKIHADNIIISNFDNENVISGILNLNYNFNINNFRSETKILVNNINSNILTISDNALIRVLIQNNIARNYLMQCDFDFNKDAKIIFNSNIEHKNINFETKASNVPITLYKLAISIFDNDSTLIFLNDYVKSGIITNGSLKIRYNNIDKFESITQDQIFGEFNLKDVNFKYNSDLPILKNGILDVKVNGSKINIPIKQVYSDNTLIKGDINLDFSQTDFKVFVKASAEGKASDLINFINNAQIENLKTNGIDLRAIQGIAKSDIDIIVETKETIPNQYKITTNITDIKWGMFNDYIKLKSNKITGIYDGNQVLLNGSCTLNDFDSNFTIKHNITNSQEFDTLIDINTKIVVDNKKINIYGINLFSGFADINLKYIDTKSVGTINVNSNLKDLDFAIEQISIHKLAGDTAKLTLNGNLTNNLYQFYLAGSNNLNISGTLESKNKENHTIILNSVRHYNTNINGKLQISPEKILVNLSGNNLDLSHFDNKYFREENIGNFSKYLDINVNLEHLLLKNNIELNNVNIYVVCNKTRCRKGNISAKFDKDNKEFIDIQLANPQKDINKWSINSSNIGTILTALDISNNLKFGELSLDILTDYNNKKSGLISTGDFRMKNFEIRNSSFFGKLISVISLPGFVNIFSNNKYIPFSDMKGKLFYKDNILLIHDSNLNGSFFDMTFKSKVDMQNRNIKAKGILIPSLYGINYIIKYIPGISSLFSSGHRKGLFSAPYFIDMKY